jgi:hypothetical protein
MQNFNLLFEALKKAAENENQGVKNAIDKVVSKHEQSFSAWSAILPLF